ncbi:hypothetical protein RBI14_15400 [Alcaligenaceae bacterium B3P038]|nr:hypothetical protein [Alcaligenaceae bacterium B3P038]
MGTRPPCLDATTAPPGQIINEGEVQLAGWMRNDVFPVLYTDRIREVIMWHREGAPVTPLVPLEALNDMRAQRDAARAALFATTEARVHQLAADAADRSDHPPLKDPA